LCVRWGLGILSTAALVVMPALPPVVMAETWLSSHTVNCWPLRYAVAVKSALHLAWQAACQAFPPPNKCGIAVLQACPMPADGV